jgi:elongator complex protein 2
MGHDDWVHSIGWAPLIDGIQPMYAVSASADKTVMIWAPDTSCGIWVNESRVGDIGGNTIGYFNAQFSTDMKHLYAVSYKGALHKWNKEDGWKGDYIVGGHLNSVSKVAWDPSGSYFASTRFVFIHCAYF